MPNENKHTQNAGGPDLNLYLRSPRPGSWLILILILLLMALMLVWAFLGNMKTTISVTGIQKDGHFVGYLMPKDALSLQPGMDIDYNGETVGILTARDTMSLTVNEVEAMVDNAYYLSQLTLNEYNLTIQADVDPDACPEGVITLEIVVGETRPLNFLMS